MSAGSRTTKGALAWMAISATHIAKIIGSSANRKSTPKIMHSEQTTSAKIMLTSDSVLPMPKGSGKLIASAENAISLSIPWLRKNIPKIMRAAKISADAATVEGGAGNSNLKKRFIIKRSVMFF